MNSDMRTEKLTTHLSDGTPDTEQTDVTTQTKTRAHLHRRRLDWHTSMILTGVQLGG